MCAACVAQGSAYVGATVVALRVMAARASAKRPATTDAKQPAGPIPLDRVRAGR